MFTTSKAPQLWLYRKTDNVPATYQLTSDQLGELKLELPEGLTSLNSNKIYPVVLRISNDVNLEEIDTYASITTDYDGNDITEGYTIEAPLKYGDNYLTNSDGTKFTVILYFIVER